jgi:hypothetical protein
MMCVTAQDIGETVFLAMACVGALTILVLFVGAAVAVFTDE